MKKKSVTIKDLIDNSIEKYSVSQDTTLGKIRKIFANENIEDLLVINKDDRCIGVIHINNIFKSPNENTKAKSLVSNISLIQETGDIPQTAKKFHTNNTNILPVVNKYEKLVGVLVDFKMAKLLLDTKEIDNIPINQIITYPKDTLSRTDNMGTVLSIYKTNEKNSELPIVENKKLFGSVSANAVCRDWSQEPVSWLDGKNKSIKTFVDAAEVSEDAVTLYLDADPTFSDAFGVMKKNEARTLFIQENEEFKGIITLNGLINFLVDLQEEEGQNVVIQIVDAPDDDVKEHGFRKAKSIIRKYTSLGDDIEIFIRFKKIPYQSKRGMFSWQCQVKVSFGKSSLFNSESTEFGSRKALNDALDKIDRQLRDEQKDLKDKSKFKSIRHLE